MVRAQLYHLLQSSDLHVPPRLKNLLAYLVEETLHGRAGNIKAYNIALEVFGRSERFNPNADPIVRVEAGKLRRQLELYYLLNPDDNVHISIPRGGYVPVFKAQDSPGEHRPASWQRAFSAPDFSRTTSSPAVAAKKEHKPILAVMPFSFSGEDPVLEHFVKGLAESLLVEMAHSHDVDALEAFAPSVGTPDLMDAVYRAKEMGARFILHGLVQRGQNSVRIYAALTDTNNARRIWTEKFDAAFDEQACLEIQDAITCKVVGMVMDSFGLINRTLLRETAHKGLDEIGVYEATLRYHAWISTFDRQDYLNAKEALEHSYAHAPDNAMVCALLSDIYSADFEFGYDLLPDALDKGLDLAGNALKLDSSCQMAHWAMALNCCLRGDVARMTSSINKVYPCTTTNPYLFVSLGLLTGMTTDLAQGKRLVEEALRLNPYSPSWCHVVPFMYHYARENYDAALDEALQMNVPTCIWNPIACAAAYGKLGIKPEGQKALEQLMALEPEFQQKRERLLWTMVVNKKWVSIIDDGLTLAGLVR